MKERRRLKAMNETKSTAAQSEVLQPSLSPSKLRNLNTTSTTNVTYRKLQQQAKDPKDLL